MTRVWDGGSETTVTKGRDIEGHERRWGCSCIDRTIRGVVGGSPGTSASAPRCLPLPRGAQAH